MQAQYPAIDVDTPGMHLHGLEEARVNADAEPPHGNFYVTVKDAGRTGWLLGPYEDVREALANVTRARDLACANDSTGRAWFYRYGTARVSIGSNVRTVFGR